VNTWTLDRFNSPAGAANYKAKFDEQWVERTRDHNEQRLVRRLLGALPKSDLTGLVLDLPCGYGRFFPALRNVAPRVIQGDWSHHMLKAAKRKLNGNGHIHTPSGYVRATALSLPFADNAFGLVLSVRLCHHLPTQEERIQYFREALRVSGKWVVFTYLDRYSLKNVVHTWKRRIVEKRPKWTMGQEEVAGLAHEAGFQVAQSVPLSRLFSGQRYTVLRRTRGLLTMKATERSPCYTEQAAPACVNSPLAAMEGAKKEVGRPHEESPNRVAV
jgi:SAM-dependent methyltransferase